MVKKQKIGTVVSCKTNKTITVSTQTRYQHKKYLKILVKTKKYMAHDPDNSCSLGDLVLIEESRPISKRKKWLLKQILATIKTKEDISE